MRFVGRFRFYSPFNAMLIHTQMPGAQFVCTARRWRKDYGREIKIGARPIVILQPMGPVLFIFDVSDTTPWPDAPPLPREVVDPFRVKSGKIGGQLGSTIENAKRDGVRVSERAEGSQSAGSIQWADTGQQMDFLIQRKPTKTTRVPVSFELLLNSILSAEARYGTLVHELAHLYCGHLGRPNDRWWPARQNLTHDAREFEAESVSYLVCTRLGIDTASDEYSTSDTDVPSVARHAQNEYRSGFQIVTRVMAEVWTRLASKSPAKARALAEAWRDSPFRLMWRLALFAAVNPALSADFAANMLVALPVRELFLSSSNVEIHRLIRARWSEFPKPRRSKVLRRLREGPLRTWFREGSDIDRAVDHSRYEILSLMTNDGFDIGAAGRALLAKISARYSEWKPKPAEQAGFHVWHETGWRDVVGDANKLKNVPDGNLVSEAKTIAANADFREGDNWQAISLSDPDRALRGLDAAASGGDWTVGFWEQLLWSRTPYADFGTETRIAQLLLGWPADFFAPVSAAASSWLNDHAKTLPNDLLWPLWDRIADASLIEIAGTEDA
jgi:hypothetical protein